MIDLLHIPILMFPLVGNFNMVAQTLRPPCLVQDFTRILKVTRLVHSNLGLVLSPGRILIHLRRTTHPHKDMCQFRPIVLPRIKQVYIQVVSFCFGDNVKEDAHLFAEYTQVHIACFVSVIFVSHQGFCTALVSQLERFSNSNYMATTTLCVFARQKKSRAAGNFDLKAKISIAKRLSTYSNYKDVTINILR